MCDYDDAEAGSSQTLHRSNWRQRRLWTRMLKIRSHLIAITIATVAASSMAQSAPGEKKYDAGASDAEIKLGNIVPYSGPASAFAASARCRPAFSE